MSSDDCELCGSVRHPDGHISDPCERCGHVEERAAELRTVQPVLVPYALVDVFGDDTFPF